MSTEHRPERAVHSLVRGAVTISRGMVETMFHLNLIPVLLRAPIGSSDRNDHFVGELVSNSTSSQPFHVIRLIVTALLRRSLTNE